MIDEQEFENESPFAEDTEQEEVDKDQEIECPYCRLPLNENEDGSYQHEFGVCQAFFENRQELQAANEKILLQRQKKEEKAKAEAENARQKVEEEKKITLGEYYDQITSIVSETLQEEIQRSAAVIQRAADDLYNAKDALITVSTDVTRSSISEKISYYQTKASETNEGNPQLEIYKDMEDRYNKFLTVFDAMERDKKQLQRKIKELSDIDTWSGSGMIDEYNNLLQLLEKIYFKK